VQAVGGGAGTGVQVFTKGQQVKIPSETRLDFYAATAAGHHLHAGKESAAAFECGPTGLPIRIRRIHRRTRRGEKAV